jgi:hypothetical protein
VLGQVASKFLNNVKNGSPLELTSPSTYTENFKDVNIASGVFSKAIKFTHNRTLLDGPGCAIYVEIIAPDNKPGYHIGTQIFVDAGKPNKVEAIINSDLPNSNSWFYNGTRTLDVILKEEAEGGRAVIPEAKRDSRETLKQVAEDYFNLVGSAKSARGGPKKMPKFAPSCMRQEGKNFFKSLGVSLLTLFHKAASQRQSLAAWALRLTTRAAAPPNPAPAVARRPQAKAPSEASAPEGSRPPFEAWLSTRPSARSRRSATSWEPLPTRTTSVSRAGWSATSTPSLS